VGGQNKVRIGCALFVLMNEKIVKP
jgi:hypothetical protein